MINVPTSQIHRLLEHALMATDSPLRDDDDYVTRALALYLREGHAAFENLSIRQIAALRDHILRIVNLELLTDCEAISNWLIAIKTDPERHVDQDHSEVQQ
jgi:hypothetical protein